MSNLGVPYKAGPKRGVSPRSKSTRIGGLEAKAEGLPFARSRDSNLNPSHQLEVIRPLVVQVGQLGPVRRLTRPTKRCTQELLLLTLVHILSALTISNRFGDPRIDWSKLAGCPGVLGNWFALFPKQTEGYPRTWSTYQFLQATRAARTCNPQVHHKANPTENKPQGVSGDTPLVLAPILTRRPISRLNCLGTPRNRVPLTCDDFRLASSLMSKRGFSTPSD